MKLSHPGELAALLTAAFWCVTALAFEQAGKRVGSLTVNLIRLVLALVFLGIYTSFTRGMFFPLDATWHNWFWLSLSGLVGFVVGDLFLFKAYVEVGARISLLIMSLAPPIAAFTSWLALGETLSWMNFFGMVLTLGGIALVVLERNPESKTEDSPELKKRRIKFSFGLTGLLFAFGGAVGQGLGLVLSKYGMQGYDSFASTQIRIITGVIGFAMIYTWLKRWGGFKKAVNNHKAMWFVVLGSVFGPFLGVSFSLISVKYTSAGIAATIMSIMPVLIIPPAIIFNKEKVSLKEVVGAVIAIVGVASFFL